MTIRTASNTDLEGILNLAEAKRTQYEHYSPTFWRRASDGKDKQRPYFLSLLEKDNVIALVSEEARRVDGFITATVGDAPPVYDPGSRVIVIDDFTVADPGKWATVGATLLEEAKRLAKAQGAHLSVVVCGHLDEPKREMLRACGFSLASEWYANPA